jgi:hypothetical protein
MELICVILAAGWFAVGWVVASAYHQRKLGMTLQSQNKETGSFEDKVTSLTVPVVGVLPPEPRTSIPISRAASEPPDVLSAEVVVESTNEHEEAPWKSRPRVEDKSRQFLTLCNDRDVRWNQAREWFESEGMGCKRLLGDDETWYLLLVSQNPTSDVGLVVPSVRRAMGAVPLGKFFHFTRYNGLDPLYPESVVEFCELRMDDGAVIQKGLIEGH